MASTPIEETHASSQIVLDSKQSQAIEACCKLSNRVVAVTGAAGTGKTTILNQAYNALKDHGYAVVLCAPTGKAAKRIKEATGINAMTVHRLLEYTHPGDPDPKTGKPIHFSYPKRNRQNPIDFDIVFCDEYSMVNTDVHQKSLFDALPNGACVRVFGDANQLQPIEEDKTKHWTVSVHANPAEREIRSPSYLDVVHRQGKDSGILLNLQSDIGRKSTHQERSVGHSLLLIDL
jgi:ATP-dependent exoDNAse (exonuclease V) alpha subunit